MKHAYLSSTRWLPLLAGRPVGAPLSCLSVLLLLSIACLVHAPDPSIAQIERLPPAATGKAGEGLPRPAAEMREAILAAVQSGRLDDLRLAVELNEIRPIIGDGDSADAMAAIRAIAGSGDGRSFLASVGAVLSAHWIALPLGPDAENNRVFIWPRLAETGIGSLTPGDATDLEAIASPEEVRAMREAGKYTSWRIGIGADGTWHFLFK